MFAVGYIIDTYQNIDLKIHLISQRLYLSVPVLWLDCCFVNKYTFFHAIEKLKN